MLGLTKEGGNYLELPIECIIADEHKEIIARVYYDVEPVDVFERKFAVVVDKFETTDPGFTAYLNTLLVQDESFAKGIATCIDQEEYQQSQAAE